jgi:hypothetical protein
LGATPAAGGIDSLPDSGTDVADNPSALPPLPFELFSEVQATSNSPKSSGAKCAKSQAKDIALINTRVLDKKDMVYHTFCYNHV